MSVQLQQRLLGELDQLVLIDPHTHINQLDPASHTLADILGYHYYTELAHSAGLPRESIEQPGIDPKEKVRRLVPKLADRVVDLRVNGAPSSVMTSRRQPDRRISTVPAD